MAKSQVSLSLALSLLLTACGVYFKGTPPPENSPLDPPAEGSASSESDTAVQPMMMWYDRYNFDEIEVVVEPSVGTGMGRRRSPDSDVDKRLFYTPPSLQAYKKRSQVLQLERERLLHENAMLHEQVGVTEDVYPWAQKELSELPSQLTHLSARQDDINLRVQVIIEEHSALLENIGSAVLDTAIELKNP